MPLVLVTTPGSATANSYADATDVDALAAELYPPPAKWDGATDDHQARALVTATRELDGMNWIGTPATETQALQWPRIDTPYDEDEVPGVVIEATCRIALFLVEQVAGGMGNPMTGGGDITSVRFGDELAMDFAEGGPSSPLAGFLAREIRPLLGRLILAPQVRLVRG